MADTLNQITLLGQAILLAVGYPGIFLVVFIENFVGPIPMPPILPLSGMLAGQGKMNFFAVWLTAVAGALAGALALYGVGMWVDERVIRSFIRRYGWRIRFSEAQLDQSLLLFNRYGGAAIVVGRMVPVLRNAVSLTSGMSRLPVHRFLFYTALISTPTIGIWVYAGYVLGENWQVVLDVIARYEVLIVIIAVIGFGIAFLLLGKRRRKEATMTRNEIE